MKRAYEIPYIENIKGDEKMIVIVVHGFNSSKQSVTAQRIFHEFPEQGIGVIAFDFPAHGESPAGKEELSVENCMADLETVEDYIKEKYPKAEIEFFCSSFGAYITLNYLTRHPDKACKVYCRSAAVDMPFLFDKPDVVEGVELVTDAFISNLKENDLFKIYRPGAAVVKMIHGSEDEVIDYGAAKAFSEKFHIPMETVAGGDHRLSYSGMPEKVMEEAVRFFK